MHSTIKRRKNLSDSNKKLYTLPSESEIMHRLQSVGSDYEDLFPMIAGHAGEQWDASRICHEFFLAIEALAYGRVMPGVRIYKTHVPRWVDALVDDREVAEAAKEILKKPPYASRV